MNLLFGGFVGATPGLIIADLSGELIGMTFLGLLLSVFGFILGAAVGWRKSDWLNGRGAVGALIGSIPGIVMFQMDSDIRISINDPIQVLHWPDIALLVLIVGFLVGLFIGNRIEGPRSKLS